MILPIWFVLLYVHAYNYKLLLYQVSYSYLAVKHTSSVAVSRGDAWRTKNKKNGLTLQQAGQQRLFPCDPKTFSWLMEPRGLGWIGGRARGGGGGVAIAEGTGRSSYVYDVYLVVP